ncbi:MAG: major tail protein [Tyzzerella sp.]|nr:major tail protein [Tyzzerella sp.]
MPESTVEKIVRSRTKSFRDIHVALVKENTATSYVTETPVKLARAIKGKISDKFTTEKIYSDDTVEDVSTTYEGTEVELEVNSLAPQDKALLFGHLYENGFLVKNKEDKAPEVAIGYRAKKLNGKYEFVWLYVGTFGQGFEDNYETEADKATTQTATLKGDFYERQIDKNYHNSVDESNLLAEHTDAAAAIKDWFAKVQEPTKATEAAE